MRIVGSRTPPVEDVIRDGENGFLVDFFAPQEIADRVIQVLGQPDDFESIRKNARQTIIENCDLQSICLPEQLRLIEELVALR